MVIPLVEIGCAAVIIVALLLLVIRGLSQRGVPPAGRRLIALGLGLLLLGGFQYSFLRSGHGPVAAGSFINLWLYEVLLMCGGVFLTVGLLLTLPLAVSVSMLGNLDWGPVVGGYVGALLLGAAYLAVGQFVSALTENQILAFILAFIVCLALYGIGTDLVVGLFSDRTASLLRALGTGSRFDSIARGVIDLRDFLYYVSLTVFFVALSVGALRAKRWA